MRTLVVSADDFGFASTINRGVIEAFEHGVVTAVSMLVHQPGWREAVQYARDTAPDLDVGLHLNLSVGSPLTPARSLRDHSTGSFLPVSVLVAHAFAGLVRSDDVYVECLAQAQQLLDVGISVTHVDGHRHLHLLPDVWEGVVRASVALGNLPIRVSREHVPFDHSPRNRLKRTVINVAAAHALRRASPPVAPLPFVGNTLRGDGEYFVALRSRLRNLPEGRSELMTHPGYVSGALPGNDPYDEEREAELRVLTSSALRDWLSSKDIALGNFRGLCSVT